MSKGPQHSAVVYTPCTVEDDGLHVLNLTLPEGMLSSDVLPDPGTQHWHIFSYLSASKHDMPVVQCSSQIQLPVCIQLI